MRMDINGESVFTGHLVNFVLGYSPDQSTEKLMIDGVEVASWPEHKSPEWSIIMRGYMAKRDMIAAAADAYIAENPIPIIGQPVSEQR